MFFPGEIDEAKKKEFDDNRVKLSETGRELSDHKGKVKELFKVVDEKLAETRRLNSEVKYVFLFILCPLDLGCPCRS